VNVLRIDARAKERMPMRVADRRKYLQHSEQVSMESSFFPARACSFSSTRLRRFLDDLKSSFEKEMSPPLMTGGYK